MNREERRGGGGGAGDWRTCRRVRVCVCECVCGGARAYATPLVGLSLRAGAGPAAARPARTPWLSATSNSRAGAAGAARRGRGVR
jgi:hypothetical protein